MRRLAREWGLELPLGQWLVDTLAEGMEGSPSTSHLVIDGIGDLVLFSLPRNAKIHGFAQLITPVRGQKEVTHFSPALWLWATD